MWTVNTREEEAWKIASALCLKYFYFFYVFFFFSISSFNNLAMDSWNVIKKVNNCFCFFLSISISKLPCIDSALSACNCFFFLRQEKIFSKKLYFLLLWCMAFVLYWVSFVWGKRCIWKTMKMLSTLFLLFFMYPLHRPIFLFNKFWLILLY